VQRKYDTSPDLQLDETQTPWRVQTQENNVAIVNTYTVQPNSGGTPATPGPEGNSPGDDEDDGDGLDQLAVKFQRSYHVNKSKQPKSPRKGSAKAGQGVTPPASATFSPPIHQSQFLSPGEAPADSFEHGLEYDEYEGLGIAGGGMTPQGYAVAPVQYIQQPVHPAQYVRSPIQMAPLQPLQGNPHIQRPQRMVPMAMYQTLSPTSPQVPFQQAVPMQQPQAPRLIRQQTQPQPQMTYDENAWMQALASQMRQQQLLQQQQQRLQTAYQQQVSPQRISKPISRSVPSSPEKRRYANQLAQVSELDLLAIPAPVTSPPKAGKQDAEANGTHLRGISFLDELFEVPAETPKGGPLAADGTLREVEEEEEPEYDEAALEADVNAWLQNENLTEGSEWLEQVVLN
jgi:hypothetical protein